MPWYDLSRPEGIIEHVMPPVVEPRHAKGAGGMIVGEVVHVLPLPEADGATPPKVQEVVDTPQE